MRGKRGFTLTEIMVVIIVIAVLSEIASPMITEFTDRSRAAATKEQMQNIKKALLQFKMDIGRFPHDYTGYTGANITHAGTDCMKSSQEFCPLVNETKSEVPTYAGQFQYCFLPVSKFRQRWKGPYMDCGSEDFMLDAWDTDIVYCHYNKGLWLHSYGPDGEPASPTCFLPNNDTDDIVVQVSPLKF